MGTSEAGAKQYTIDWSKIENYIKHSLQGVPQNEEMHVKIHGRLFQSYVFYSNWRLASSFTPTTFWQNTPKAHDMERNIGS